MIVRDWCAIGTTEMARLYARETAHWIRDLAWDPAATWATVEVARTTWGLPGLLVVDASGQVRGWTFYLPVENRLDVGAFVSDSRETTTALAEALIARAGSSQRLGGLVYASAPELASILTSRHVPFQRYSYRLRPLNETLAPTRGNVGCPPAHPPGVLRAWSESDIESTGDLLYESYESHAGPIGPGATPDDWREYVANLARHGGCGTLSPAMSRVLMVDGVVAGTTLVSTIAPQTAHLVQLAVRRAHQGSGRGRALLAAAMTAARDAGYSAMSLLAAEDNQPGLRLYEQAGFTERGTFVALRGPRV